MVLLHSFFDAIYNYYGVAGLDAFRFIKTFSIYVCLHINDRSFSLLSL